MDDLLSSIRKAIDNEVGSASTTSSGESRGTLMRGALREMRVSSENLSNSRSGDDIESLRNRILRSATEVPPIAPPSRSAAPRVTTPPQAPPMRDDFKDIMAGPRARPPVNAAPQRAIPRSLPPALPAPVMRPSYDEQDDDLTYPAQQPASAGHYDHDPYGAPPAEQHYGYEQPHADGYGEPYDQQGYGQPRMLSHNAEAATADAFRHLYDSLLSRGLGDRSVEDMTRELLRGMLKQWLDDNLPSLVERLVRDEISRVARNGR